MASRLISDLHPNIIPLYYAFKKEMDARKVDFLVTCTYRSNEEQTALFARGRTISGTTIVTNAKAGESAHNTTLLGKPAAMAFDIAVFENGKICWDVKDSDWHTAGEIGLIVGLDWAGVWKSFREYPHFQLPNWRNIK